MRTLSLFVLLCGLNASAVEISDEGGVFAELANYTRNNRFEDVLKCGQLQTFEATQGTCQFTCNVSFCTNTCLEPSPKTFAVSVEDCSNGLAHIYSENGMSLAVTPGDFTEGGGTFVKVFLQDIGRYIKPVGKVVLEHIFPAQIAIIGNGDKVVVSAFQIWGSMDYGAGIQRPQFAMIVVPEFKDVRQIARFSLFSDEDFYRLPGVVDDEGF